MAEEKVCVEFPNHLPESSFVVKFDHLLFYFRYNEMFFVIDTCQASSMYDKMYSPNVLAVASSLVGEDSLSVS